MGNKQGKTSKKNTLDAERSSAVVKTALAHQGHEAEVTTPPSESPATAESNSAPQTVTETPALTGAIGGPNPALQGSQGRAAVSAVTDIDLDAILDESIAETKVGEDLFPLCADCSCCSGYIYVCACPKAPGTRSKCKQCEGRFNAPEASPSPRPRRRQRTNEAGDSSASELPRPPAMSRGPSLHRETEAQEWCVRLFPAGQRGFTGQMYGALMYPVVVNALGSSTSGRALAWPDRGWGSEADFQREFGEALARGGVESNGVVIARSQTKAEAVALCASLAASSARASIFRDPNPPLVSSVGPPPNRQILETALPEVGLFPELPSLGVTAAPEEKAFHIVLHLPEGAPAVGSPTFDAYVESFFLSKQTELFHVLGAPDPAQGHPESYAWPERGWAGANIFAPHTLASMKAYGNCVVARKLNFKNAYVLQLRFSAVNLRTSLIMLGDTASLPEEVPQCRNHHPMNLVPNRSIGDIFSFYCDMCTMAVEDSDIFSCRPCDNDYCRLCACIVRNVESKILFGVGAGGTMPFPSFRPGNELVQQLISRQVNPIRALPPGNSKPGTKQSVIDALVVKEFGSADMFEHVGTSCSICLSDYKEGDKITELQCQHKHCFHFGEHRQSADSEAVECDGIVTWLRKNNDCPLCRHQFEAEVSEEGTLSAVDLQHLAGPWTCPGCQTQQAEFSCTQCGVRRNVVFAANVTAAPLFQSVENLFFKIMAFHQRPDLDREGLDYAAELSRLQREVSDLLESRFMTSVVSGNWMIKNSVRKLLLTALRGDTRISFEFEGDREDLGSTVLYSMLMDRLRNRAAVMGVDLDIARPNLAEIVHAADWQCLLCCRTCLRSVDDCPDCGAGQIVRLMVTRSEDVAKMLKDLVDIFIKGLEVMTKPDMVESQRRVAVNDVKSELSARLTERDVEALESRNFSIRAPITVIFAELISGKKTVPFRCGDAFDRNSTALYAHFIRQLIERQAAETSTNPSISAIKVDAPSMQALALDSNYEPFESQVYPVGPNVGNFLKANKDLFLGLAQKISEGYDSRCWDAFMDTVIPSLAESGWTLGQAFRLLKQGVRDLHTIVRGIDVNSAAVVEAILRVINRLESYRIDDSTAPIDLEDIPSPVPLRRQVSVGSGTKMLLEELENRLGDMSEFRKVLKFLVKTLSHLQMDQTNIAYRLIHKDSSSAIDFVICNPEVVSILKFAGFVEETQVFRLVTMNRDRIARALSVVKSRAAEVGIEIM